MMNLSTIYRKTTKGARALAAKSKTLSSNSMRVLSYIDDKSNAEAVMAETKLSESRFILALSQLLHEDYISAAESFSELDIRTPIVVAEISVEEFFQIETAAQGGDSAIRAREQKEAAARAKAYAEEQLRLEAAARAQEEAERKLLMVTDILAKSGDWIDIEKLAAKETGLATQAEQKEQAAAEARSKAAAAAKTKREAAAKARAEAERKTQGEAEARAKAVAEAQAQAEAERKARAEAEAKREADEKARLEAEVERARQAAEQKAREEARARAKAEAEAKARAEAEARAKAKAEAQEKREAEARVRAEAERIAKEQAKARKQAADLEKAEAKRQAKREAAARALIKAEGKARKRAERDPVDTQWLQSTIAAGHNLLIYSSVTVFAAVLILLVALPLVNLSILIEPMEKLASENINEPVVIKEIHVVLWPQPQLVLDGISIGTLLDIKATTVRVFPVLSTLFNETRALKSIEVEAFALDQDDVSRPFQWISSSNNRNQLKIDYISFKKSSIKLHGVEQLVFFNSDISLNPLGKLKNAKLYSDKNTLAIEILPQNDAYEINLAANEWQPPLGAQIMFDKLSAKGVADRHGINFSNIEGKLYGGDLKAQMALHWADRWGATGKFEILKINLEEITPKFSDTATLKGYLNSSATFSLRADDLAKLIDTPDMNANFEIMNGYVDGIDLVRAMQVTGQEQAGGSTHFEKLSGHWMLKDRHYRLRQLALKAGQLQAHGDIDISADQDVSGKIATKLVLKSRQLQSRFSLSGKLGSVRLNQ